jgi:pimeloyl-ACP methyl ester esterase
LGRRSNHGGWQAPGDDLMAWFERDSGSRLRYDEQGAGTPIVFVHGWCMSSDIWRLQREVLAGSFRVITIDLPGHGRSPAPSDGFHLKACVDDIAGLFEYLQLDRALLAGWSLGSLVALEACEAVRERLAGLVLVAGTPRFTEGDGFPYGLSRMEVDGMARKVQRSIRRAVDGFTARMFASGELDDPLLAGKVANLLSTIALPDTDVALQALGVLVETDLHDRLALIDLPTLIISGDRDVICPPQASEFLAQRIRFSQQVVFTGCGHAPFLTQSGRFNACLEEFRGVVSGRAD